MASQDHSGLEGRRLIVVSNRLPVTITQKGDDYEFKMSSGGLVAALAGLRDQVDMVWLGSPGFAPDGVDTEPLAKKLFDECKCVPVWLDKQLAHEHYNLFSNEVLWPLFHYKENIEFKEKRIFESYTKANEIFCKTVLDVYRPGDLVWVHDYHLMLLPKMLKLRTDTIAVAFFLHVPFPSSEVYRILPEREEILDGVLHCDLIGFHTYDYARHFVHSCTRALGLETTANEVTFKGKTVTVGVFPVGMDFTKFADNIDNEKVVNKIKELQTSFKGQTIIIGVDRLDYIKGIPQKLQALERLFVTNPDLVGKVSLIQIAVPSREVVDEYQKLRREVETLVGRINTHYGDIGITPVHYLYKSVPFEDLLAMYSVSDICLITSLRDGMNLVAQEFVACQNRNQGVLILSEFAGSARCLAHALRVNPWNVGQVAEAIEKAITMSKQEREQRHRQLFSYVSTHAANHWGSTFVKEFVRIADLSLSAVKQSQPVSTLINRFQEGAKKKLLIFSVDGVLCPFKVVPSTSIIGEDVMEALRQLDGNSNADVVILSGRKKDDLSRFFGDLSNVTLAAEHGYFVRRKGDTEWEELCIDHGDMGWYDEILEVLEHYRDRTPGSSLEGRAEGKESTLMWNFRGADSEFGAMQAQELHLHLANHTNHNFIMDLSIIRKSIECRPKGLTVDRVISEITRELQPMGTNAFDFVCYFGNEPPEGEFKPLHGCDIYTCAISSGNKKAPAPTFLLSCQNDMTDLIRSLAGLPCVQRAAPVVAASSN
eukprot:TRINITY_DN13191_c0_g3_i1.p1 TRINITY_DN13191_c0_g3~~TRINITY_DN13191_c0_g3_i1.p1  ORF type:complete len:767 (+),score=330.11 TRINITY_DN13191_c0_g3_i1:265-2565(+)